jgi:hypothetical protein
VGNAHQHAAPICPVMLARLGKRVELRLQRRASRRRPLPLLQVRVGVLRLVSLLRGGWNAPAASELEFLCGAPVGRRRTALIGTASPVHCQCHTSASAMHLCESVQCSGSPGPETHCSGRKPTGQQPCQHCMAAALKTQPAVPSRRRRRAARPRRRPRGHAPASIYAHWDALPHLSAAAAAAAPLRAVLCRAAAALLRQEVAAEIGRHAGGERRRVWHHAGVWRRRAIAWKADDGTRCSRKAGPTPPLHGEPRHSKPLVLFGVQNRTFSPLLATTHRILSPVMGMHEAAPLRLDSTQLWLQPSRLHGRAATIGMHH